MIFHDISVGLFFAPNSLPVDCVGEEPPPSNLRRDHTGAGIPSERLCDNLQEDNE